MSTSGDDDAAWAPRPPARPAQPAAPRLVEGYRDAVEIGRGGDSVVYRAHQEALDRDVAIKVVELDDPASVARFERELAITVRLGRQHPHIMTVLDTRTTVDGRPCLIMDLVELGSLHDRLVDRGPLPVSEVVAAGSVVADALSFAHAQGVLHRDVKPQNILVLPTSYVLADFGLARAIDAEHSASLDRLSYRHASPQILDGETPTVADDLYSLGSTLFTLLDGRAPFAAADPDDDSALSYLRRARTEAPRRLLRVDVPDALAEVVARCLAKRREDRFPDAAALRAALLTVPTESRGWAAEAPPAAPPSPVDQLPSVVDDRPPGAVDHEAREREEPPASAALAAPLPTGAVAEPRPEPRPADQLPSVVDSRPPAAVDHSGVDAGLDAVVETAEPAPIAVSALAHLPAGTRTAPPEDATGMRPRAEPEPRHAAPDRAGRRWAWIAGAAVVALATGLVIGLVGTRDDAPQAGTTRTVTPPVGVSDLPTASIGSGVPTAAGVVDPAITPVITTLRRNGNGVDLRWADPSHGAAQFVIKVDGNPQKVTSLGVTAVKLDGFPRGYHCVIVSAFARAEDGIHHADSKPRCATT